MSRKIALLAATTAAALALVGCSQQAQDDDGMDGMDHGSGSSSESSNADFNDADAMFASMMIPHHEQAVEMSEMLLAKDDVPADVADLAQRIMDAQAPEIDTMNTWLDEWGVDASEHEGMDHGDDGMMSDDEMAELEDATGPDASRIYLEQMIEHHEGAITMAEDEVADGQNPDAVDLAQTIVDTQQAEIEEMQQLLTAL
ncbi:hypothetical protein GCM10009846_22560 [Agrococcus versicolor]|uniref:DUF305 domain-containing protein n=1 Tax=Agrococcus versicolor TaxID=501482 RepID=A0ABN3AUN0_9MICO